MTNAILRFADPAAAGAVAAELAAAKPTKLIDQFVPTDPANLSSLPVDPSGRLLAATLVREGAKLPSNAGVWQRPGWLHLAVDPAGTATAPQSAGVDYVSQRLATVYQASNADAAQRL